MGSDDHSLCGWRSCDRGGLRAPGQERARGGTEAERHVASVGEEPPAGHVAHVGAPSARLNAATGHASSAGAERYWLLQSPVQASFASSGQTQRSMSPGPPGDRGQAAALSLRRLPLETARRAGAGYALEVIVRKTSTLVQEIALILADVERDEVLGLHSIPIRSDGDGAWRQGLLYILECRLRARAVLSASGRRERRRHGEKRPLAEAGGLARSGSTTLAQPSGRPAHAGKPCRFTSNVARMQQSRGRSAVRGLGCAQARGAITTIHHTSRAGFVLWLCVVQTTNAGRPVAARRGP